ncbi:MAG TPA: hypothetical protein VFS31_10170 [Chitinophagaceae bacterium]|nr:hypothetical protein [Chitinophagaceae bacterium]
MKNFLLLAAICWTACNQPAQKPAEEMAAGTAADSIQYAYTMEHPVDYWEKGDPKNIAIAMSCLKAWENRQIEECLSYFADSVRFSTNGFDSLMSKEGLGNMFNEDVKKISSLKIKMDDCESVKSKDGKMEYVSLWYKQYWTTSDGKSDSAAVMDDIRMKDGKIASIDEKTRTYPVKK